MLSIFKAQLYLSSKVSNTIDKNVSRFQMLNIIGHTYVIQDQCSICMEMRIEILLQVTILISLRVTQISYYKVEYRV